MDFLQGWRVRQSLRVGGAALGLGLMQHQLSQAGQRLLAQPESRGPELAAVGLSLGVSTGAVLCHRWLRQIEPSWTFRRFITLFALVNGLFFALFAALFLGPTAAELVLLGPLLTFIVAIMPTAIISATIERYAAIRPDGPSVALLFCGFNLLIWVVLLGWVAPLTALVLWAGLLALGLAIVAVGVLPLVLGLAAISNLALALGTALVANRELDVAWTTIVGRSLATTLTGTGPAIGLTTLLVLGVNWQLFTDSRPLTLPLQSLAWLIQTWARADR